MNTYRATVSFKSIGEEFTTYVGARTADEAKAKLQSEGFTVVALWVLELAGA